MNRHTPVGPGQRVMKVSAMASLEGELQDHREESFCRMVADGMPLGQAYQRVGFNGRKLDAAHKLFALPRIRDRVEQVLEARAATAAITLPQVTDMLSRVFVGAVHKEEYSAAHNAAFSLARLYGHVTEKSQVEVLRKPSREPDAPAELSLTAWIGGMMGSGQGSVGLLASGGPLSRAPAALLATPSNQGPSSSPAISEGPGPAAQQLDLFNDLNSLAAPRDGREIENTSWQDRLTGTPHAGARTAPVGVRDSQKDGSPLQVEGTGPDGGWPKIEDLF